MKEERVKRPRKAGRNRTSKLRDAPGEPSELWVKRDELREANAEFLKAMRRAAKKELRR